MVFLSLFPPSLNGGLSNHWLSRANRTIYFLRKFELFSSWGPRKLRVNRAQKNRTIYYLRNSNYLFCGWEPRKLRVNRAQENRTIYYLRNSNYLFSSWEPHTHPLWQWESNKANAIMNAKWVCLRQGRERSHGLRGLAGVLPCILYRLGFFFSSMQEYFNTYKKKRW